MADEVVTNEHAIPPGDGAPEEPLRPAAAKALRKLQASEPPKRGRLRIYLGMAPGVGKTFAMLNEGRRRKSRGADVVVGFVETYNRPNTMAQLCDLEVVPRKQIEYRGVTLEEMNPDAVIARRPQVALVDELAHTNTPGSKHEKRWQDVYDLLDAGIHVVATVNVQHLESLADIVETITGVKVRERIPDRVIDDADEVELVDMSPQALRARIKHGNVYPKHRAERALNEFFREGNLTALRELALRRVAQEVDEQLQDYMHEHQIEKTWPACERVMVCFDARPQSANLVRRAWRIADRLQAELLAVFVAPRGWERAPEAERKTLAANQRVAEDLGAEVLQLQGDVATELARVAHERNVTRIVIGHSERSRWYELLHGSVVNKLLRAVPNVDVQVMAVEEEHPS
ncbi:MAG TPA: universal stress protein [Chloroflexota bacterium]|jgi:two-component system sensor histidine kinase KdpD